MTTHALVQHRRATTTDRTLTTAAGIIAYAAYDPTIKPALQQMLVSAGISRHAARQQSGVLRLSRWQIPHTADHALERMQWLVSAVAANPAETQTARALLARLTDLPDSDTTPKNLVLGLVGVAIIGPTLGLIKKTRNQCAHVVLRDDLHTMSAQSELTAAGHAALGLTADAFHSVRGQTQQLDPDIAHWFFGNQSTTHLRTGHTTLRMLHRTAQEEQLMHHLTRDARGIAAIAFSPAVHDDLFNEHELTPIA